MLKLWFLAPTVQVWESVIYFRGKAWLNYFINKSQPGLFIHAERTSEYASDQTVSGFAGLW